MVTGAGDEHGVSLKTWPAEVTLQRIPADLHRWKLWPKLGQKREGGLEDKGERSALLPLSAEEPAALLQACAELQRPFRRGREMILGAKLAETVWVRERLSQNAP